MFIMKHTVAVVVLLMSAACLITEAQLSVNLSQAELGTTAVPLEQQDIEKHKTTTTTVSTTVSTSTTTPSTTTSTAAPTKPATTPTTSSSSTSTTTTSTTTTTTPPPTTTTSSTTKKPETTTSAPVTTTTSSPAPKPYPEPEVGTWNSSCIMLRMAVQLNFTYETKDNKTAQALYNIPKNAVVEDAHCDMNTTQFLQINWGPNTAQHSMVLQFDRVNGTTNMTMLMFTLPLMSDSLPNAKDNQTIQLIHRGGDFSTAEKMSYHCTRPQHFNLTETVMHSDVMGTVKVRDVQVEAFRAPNASGFSTARDCDSSETSDVAPIAVGIALGALILIVLISYLCARRRSTSRGYVSF